MSMMLIIRDFDAAVVQEKTCFCSTRWELSLDEVLDTGCLDLHITRQLPPSRSSPEECPLDREIASDRTFFWQLRKAALHGLVLYVGSQFGCPLRSLIDCQCSKRNIFDFCSRFGLMATLGIVCRSLRWFPLANSVVTMTVL